MMGGEIRVLVTGAFGWTARAIIESLRQGGHAVVAFDLPAVACPLELKASVERVVLGDVSRFDDIERALEGIWAVVHLAVAVGEDDYQKPDVPFAVNVKGTYNLLEACRRQGVRRVVLLGSAPVHLDHPAERVVLATDSLQTSRGADHLYDLTKRLQEEIARDFCQAFSMTAFQTATAFPERDVIDMPNHQNQAITYRWMDRSEVGRIGEIDRSEQQTLLYRQHGDRLEEVPMPFDIPGWQCEGEGDHSVAHMVAFCRDHLERGGLVRGAFDGDRLVGVAVLQPRLTPTDAQLAFLHVSKRYRRQGIAGALSDCLAQRARELGARRLYVSATPTQSAVAFYLRQGFQPTAEVNLALFQLEPEDIHMIKELPPGDRLGTGIAGRFLAALAASDPSPFDGLFAEDVTLRIYDWHGQEAHRSRDRVMRELMSEWSTWPDPSVQLLSTVEGEHNVALEYRIQATEAQRYVEHNRSAFLTIKDGQIEIIDLYCARPIPSARRKDWIAPATLSEEKLHQLFDSNRFIFEVRVGIPHDISGTLGLEGFRISTGRSHPSENSVMAVRWTEEETDVRIKALIAYHQEREIGFNWLVSPYDTPADLAERLERHGMVLAGEQVLMARVGLERVDIPVNPAVEIRLLDPAHLPSMEAVLDILAEAFHWTQEQVDQRRDYFFESRRAAIEREEELAFLAWLEGRPVAFGRLHVGGNIAYLSGAATRPAYRRRRIYATLLRRRLEAARAQGYQIVTLDAQPMSRPIVARYGFHEYARSRSYAWMPEIDMDVIGSLMPS